MHHRRTLATTLLLSLAALGAATPSHGDVHALELDEDLAGDLDPARVVLLRYAPPRRPPLLRAPRPVPPLALLDLFVSPPQPLPIPAPSPYAPRRGGPSPRPSEADVEALARAASKRARKNARRLREAAR